MTAPKPIEPAPIKMSQARFAQGEPAQGESGPGKPAHGESVVGRRRSPVARTLRRAIKQRLTQVGLVLTLAVVLVGIFGPMFAPHDPTEFVAIPFVSSAPGAPFGTDHLGHDVLSRVLSGGRSLLWMSSLASALGVGTGVVLGLVAGYHRNWIDNVIMRSLDMLYAFPFIVLVMLFVSLLGSNPFLVVGLVGLAWVPGVARTTRGLTLEFSTRQFVEYCQAVGMPTRRVLRREVLPNLATPILVEFALRLTWSIGLIAALSFLGFGLQPPRSDWGLMINENRDGLTLAPWSIILPVGVIAVLTIGVNLIAEGLSRSIARNDGQGSAS